MASTRVGGIPEVLPPRFIRFAAPDAGDIERALGETLEAVIDSDGEDKGRPTAKECHQFVRESYR